MLSLESKMAEALNSGKRRVMVGLEKAELCFVSDGAQLTVRTLVLPTVKMWSAETSKNDFKPLNAFNSSTPFKMKRAVNSILWGKKGLH